MQRWNCVALFAALAIGFGAVQAQAAKVNSVTVSPANGATVGIGMKFTVTAVVQDFTPSSQDAVLLYLNVQGDSTTVVSDAPRAEDADPQRLEVDAASDGALKGSTDSGNRSLLAIINGSLGTLDPDPGDLELNESGGAAPTDASANFIVAHSTRAQAEAAAKALDDDKDGTKPAAPTGDGGYIRAQNAAVGKRTGTTTYTWQVIVHHSSDEVDQVRAAVLVEDWDEEDVPAVEDDPDTAADETAAEKLAELVHAFGGLKISPAEVAFNIDAIRPENPESFSFVKGDGTAGTKVDALRSGEGEDDQSTAAIGEASDLPVGGIDDVLHIEVKVGPENAANIAEGARLKISLADTFFYHGDSPKDTQSIDVFKIIRDIQEGDFKDLTGDAQSTSLVAHIVDEGENESCATSVTDSTPTDDCDAADTVSGLPLTDGLPFRLDSSPPEAIDSLLVKIVGDAVKKFASGDTLTDGTLNTTKDYKGKTDYDYADDLKPLLFSTSEALSELKIEIMDAGVTDEKKITTFTLKNSALADPILGEGAVESRMVFEVAEAEKTDGKLGAAAKGKLTEPVEETGGFTGAGSSKVKDAEALVGNKTKTVKVTATDLAGNPGSTLTYEDVYLDIAAPTFGDPVKDVFPSRGLETIEEEEGTFKVTFVLSEDVDSLLVTYRTIEGEDEETERTLSLDGKNLEKGTRRDLEVKGLEDDTDYELSLLAKDPAGNFNRVLVDTFTYDEDYEVPPAASFKVESSVDGGTLEKNAIEANTAVVLTITALAEAAEGEDEGQTAHTYRGEAVLTVAGRGTIKFSKAGDEEVDLADQDPGVGSLLEEGWILGKRDVTIVPEGGAPANHSVKVEDLSDGDNPLTGVLDSVLVTKATTTHHINLARASEDEIVQGTPFMVKVAVVDTFDNVRLGDDGFVEVTVTEVGVEVPPGALAYTDGEATFAVNSGGHSGELTLTASDVGDRTILGTLTLSIGAAPPPDPPEPVPPPTAPDAPDTLFAQDYKGALGTGDQGGFVFLTWDSSDDHGTLSGYRIYRQLRVNVLEDQTGAGKLMLSEEGQDVDVPWATPFLARISCALSSPPLMDTPRSTACPPSGRG